MNFKEAKCITTEYMEAHHMFTHTRAHRNNNGASHGSPRRYPYFSSSCHAKLRVAKKDTKSSQISPTVIYKLYKHLQNILTRRLGSIVQLQSEQRWLSHRRKFQHTLSERSYNWLCCTAQRQHSALHVSYCHRQCAAHDRYARGAHSVLHESRVKRQRWHTTRPVDGCNVEHEV